MKRFGFLARMGGALAAAALPIPKLPVPKAAVVECANVYRNGTFVGSVVLTPESLQNAFLVMQQWRPDPLIVHPKLYEQAKAFYGG